MSGEDCFYLAKERIDGQNPLTDGGIDYAMAIEWAEASLQLTENETKGTEIKDFIRKVKVEHDLRFIGPTAGMGWSYYPNEQFFISKFGNDLMKSGAQMRMEENEVFKHRYSSDQYGVNYHIRDYHRLCRGEKLVSANFCHEF